MTLRADLTALLAHAGITDVDVDRAVEDEHVRIPAYLRVISVAAAAHHRDGDRTLVATIVRDPMATAARTAVVELVDRIASRSASAGEFQRWAAGILPEVGQFEFIHRRVRDWTLYLSIEDGHVPTPDELAAATDWMQRMLAERSTSVPTLTVLAEHGRYRKIRNIARNRAREVRR
jgi:hypothetical protein